MAFSQLKEYKPKLKSGNTDEMERGDSTGRWREVRLWEVRTAEYVCQTLDTYMHKEVPEKVKWLLLDSKHLWFPLTKFINFLVSFSHMHSEAVVAFPSDSM